MDPCLVFFENTWWMFVGGSDNGTCYLYYAARLEGPWTEHPVSPIVRGDRSKARPGGRPFVYAGNHLVRLAQKCDVVYGEAVRAFQVDQIDTQHYSEHEIPESPLVGPGGMGWHAWGMHTVDAWWTGDSWIAAVDGTSSYSWKIGIYHTVATSAVPSETQGIVGGPTHDAPCSATVVPNPFLEGTRILLRLPECAPGAAAVLRVFDSTGRVMRTLSSDLRATHLDDVRAVYWNGLDDHGHAVPAGIYFVRFETSGRWPGVSVVKLR